MAGLTDRVNADVQGSFTIKGLAAAVCGSWGGKRIILVFCRLSELPENASSQAAGTGGFCGQTYQYGIFGEAYAYVSRGAD
jgi:hypothetical protein